MAKTSWRDDVSEVVEQDFDGLFAAAVDVAMQQTGGDTTIVPFVLERDHDGDTSMRTTASGSDITGESLPGLYRRDDLTDLRTLAFAFEVVGPSGVRALCLWLESREASIQIAQEFQTTPESSVDLLGVRAGRNQPRVEWAPLPQ